jgi:hypothetical protein
MFPSTSNDEKDEYIGVATYVGDAKTFTILYKNEKNFQ